MGGCLSSFQNSNPPSGIPEGRLPVGSDAATVKSATAIKGRHLRKTATDSLLLLTTNSWREKLNALARKHYALVSLFIYSSDCTHATALHSAGIAAFLVPPGLVTRVTHASSHALLLEGKKPLLHSPSSPLEPLPLDWSSLEAFAEADSFLLLPLRNDGQLYGSVLLGFHEADCGSEVGMYGDERCAAPAMYDMDELELLSQCLSMGLITSATDLEALRVVANAATLIQGAVTLQDAVASLAEGVQACLRLSTRLDLECLPAVAYHSCQVAAFFRAVRSAHSGADTLTHQKQALLLLQSQALLLHDQQQACSGTRWLTDDSPAPGLGSGAAAAADGSCWPAAATQRDLGLSLSERYVSTAADGHSHPNQLQQQNRHHHKQQQQQLPSRPWLQGMLAAQSSGGGGIGGGGGSGSGLRWARTGHPAWMVTHRNSMDRGGGGCSSGSGGCGGAQSPRGPLSMSLQAAATPGSKVRATAGTLQQTLLAQHLELIAGGAAPAAASTIASETSTSDHMTRAAPPATGLRAAVGSGCGGIGSTAGSETGAGTTANAGTGLPMSLSVAVVPNCAAFLMADERQPYKDVLHLQRMLPQARAHSLVMVVAGALERPYSSNGSSQPPLPLELRSMASVSTGPGGLQQQQQQLLRLNRGGVSPAAGLGPVTHGSGHLHQLRSLNDAVAAAAVAGLKHGSESGHVVGPQAAGAAATASTAPMPTARPHADVTVGHGPALSSSSAAAAISAAAAAGEPTASLALYVVSSEIVPRVILDQVADEARQVVQVLYRPLACALTGPALAGEWSRFTQMVLGRAATAGSGAAAAAAVATAVSTSGASSLRPLSLPTSVVQSSACPHPPASYHLDNSTSRHLSVDDNESATMMSVVLDSAANAAHTGTLSMMISSMRDVLSTVQLERMPDYRPAAQEDIYAVRLLKVIGRGGQGMVFLGQLYNTIVAIKIIPSSEDSNTGAAAAAVGAPEAAAAPAVPPSPGPEACDAVQKLQQRQKRWLVRDALEVAVTSTISHPHIVQVLNFFTDALVVEYSNEQGRYRLLPREDGPSATGASNTAIVMEYCDAGTLKQAVDNGCFVKYWRGSSLPIAQPPDPALVAATAGHLPPPRLNLVALLTSLLEVAAGLRHLHGHGLVHCDIKPSNVLLRSCTADVRGWVCKLSDFGCVRVMNEVEPSSGRPVFHSISPVGSLSYMAPESMFRDTYLDASIDVYSFGIVMWECATGQLPYAGVPAQQLPALVRRGLRPTFHLNVPSEYRQIACQCWAQDPRRRPTAAALMQLLQRMLSRTLNEADAHEALSAQQQKQPANPCSNRKPIPQASTAVELGMVAGSRPTPPPHSQAAVASQPAATQPTPLPPSPLPADAPPCLESPAEAFSCAAAAPAALPYAVAAAVDGGGGDGRASDSGMNSTDSVVIVV